jgi:hypothetical protein
MRLFKGLACAALLAVAGACSGPTEPKEKDCYAAMERVRALRGEPASGGYGFGADGSAISVWNYGATTNHSATTYVFKWGGTLSFCKVTES